MSLVTGRVVLPYGAHTETTPVCGHIRYVWVGGVHDRGSVIIVPGVAVARIIDGVIEGVHLSPGRWAPVLVVDNHRYELPEIVVDGSEVPPTPAPEPVPPAPEPVPPAPEPVPPAPEPVPPAPAQPEVQALADGVYTVPAATVRTVSDGGYTIEFDGAHWAIAHTGDGNYKIEESH